jgi:hypothetical protein
MRASVSSARRFGKKTASPEPASTEREGAVTKVWKNSEKHWRSVQEHTRYWSSGRCCAQDMGYFS